MSFVINLIGSSTVDLLMWNFEFCFLDYTTTSNKRKQKPKHLQNYDKRLDMEQHPFKLINFFIAVL